MVVFAVIAVVVICFLIYKLIKIIERIKIKNNIKIENKLPIVASYIMNGERVISKCEISEIHLDIDGDYLEILFYGKKVFDQNGEYGSDPIIFRYILKDSNGSIVTSKNVNINNLVVNQKLGDDGYYYDQICDITNLSAKMKYTLKITDFTH